MKKYHKPKVGDEVFLVKKSYRPNQKQETQHIKVSRVGRKYFYVEKYQGLESAFYIDTWIEKNDINYKDRCYPDKQMYLDEINFERNIYAIRNFFNDYYCRKGLTLNLVRAVVKLLSIKVSEAK